MLACFRSSFLSFFLSTSSENETSYSEQPRWRPTPPPSKSSSEAWCQSSLSGAGAQAPTASSSTSTADRVICPRSGPSNSFGKTKTQITLSELNNYPAGPKSIQRGLPVVQRDSGALYRRGLYLAHWYVLHSCSTSTWPLSTGAADTCDINVSPDKRSILLHHEANLIAALKVRCFICNYELLEIPKTDLPRY